MSSVFSTPIGHVWMSNGSADALLQGCAALARRSGATEFPEGRAIVAMLDELRLESGLGMLGFSVHDDPPFRDPACRRILAALVADLAHASAEIPCDETVTFVPWHELRAYVRCQWLSRLERIHVGIVASLPGEPFQRLAVAVPPEERSAIDAMDLLDRRTDLRERRERGEPASGVAEERALLVELAHRLRGAGRIFEPKVLRDLLCDRAQMEEGLGRLADAAATWREVAGLPGDPEDAAIAAEMAADSARRAG